METDLTAALAEFQKEVLNTPKHWPSLFVIASIHIRQGTAEPAIQSLREAMKIVPVTYRWLCNAELGRANMTPDNLNTAITEFQTAVRLMPSNANVHYFLSEALRRAGRKADAEKELFYSRRRRHTRSLCDWSSDVCSSDPLDHLVICDRNIAFPTKNTGCSSQLTLIQTASPNDGTQWTNAIHGAHGNIGQLDSSVHQT